MIQFLFHAGFLSLLKVAQQKQHVVAVFVRAITLNILTWIIKQFPIHFMTE